MSVGLEASDNLLLNFCTQTDQKGVHANAYFILLLRCGQTHGFTVTNPPTPGWLFTE